MSIKIEITDISHLRKTEVLRLRDFFQGVLDDLLIAEKEIEYHDYSLKAKEPEIESYGPVEHQDETETITFSEPEAPKAVAAIVKTKRPRVRQVKLVEGIVNNEQQDVDVNSEQNVIDSYDELIEFIGSLLAAKKLTHAGIKEVLREHNTSNLAQLIEHPDYPDVIDVILKKLHLIAMNTK